MNFHKIMFLTKTEISPKLKCPKTKMSRKLKCNQIISMIILCILKNIYCIYDAQHLALKERDDGAGRVEGYQCKTCGAQARFPRYHSKPEV